jgi:alkaline phosphatase D
LGIGICCFLITIIDYFYGVKKIIMLLYLCSVFSVISQTEFKIAFGSCGHQEKPIPIFDEIAAQAPDVFIFLGDNIYGDTKNGKVLQRKYAQLAAKESYQNLKKASPIIATWDDHDYGKNDSGKEFSRKKRFKKLFLDFFDEPKESIRRSQQGIYTSYSYEVNSKIIQIILLDTRTFRDKLLKCNNANSIDTSFKYELDYLPHYDPTKSFLGEQQWNWLKTTLEQKADYRIIGSSTQFGISYNGYEAWANFPHEQLKMLRLIEETKANGLVFISGDVHYAEISKISAHSPYPIYDITSSGLTQTWHLPTPNKNRIDGPFMGNNYGLINIYTEQNVLKVEIRNSDGQPVINKEISLQELQIAD